MTQQEQDETLERAAAIAEGHASHCVDPGSGCAFAIAAEIRALKRTLGSPSPCE